METTQVQITSRTGFIYFLIMKRLQDEHGKSVNLNKVHCQSWIFWHIFIRNNIMLVAGSGQDAQGLLRRR